MNAVFDTNILIDYLKGIDAARDEMDRFDHPAISIITQIEVMVGVRNAEEEALVQAFLNRFRILDLSKEIGHETIQLRRKFRLKIPDAIVYATARTQGGLLVTRNTRDFSPDWVDVRMPYTV
jgi:predicted nucleic acid-binding protein